jgi:alkylhydroperoxidase family enzyme
VTEQQLLDLGRHRESDAFSDVEKLALDYALALTETPAVVTDELFAELRKHLSEPQMVELTAVVAFENYLARFNRGFDVQASGFSEGAFCPIPDHAAPRSG